jgi:hypothetical protein
MNHRSHAHADPKTNAGTHALLQSRVSPGFWWLCRAGKQLSLAQEVRDSQDECYKEQANPITQW